MVSRDYRELHAKSPESDGVQSVVDDLLQWDVAVSLHGLISGEPRWMLTPDAGLSYAKTIQTKPSAALEADETAQKRAQWKQFGFAVEALGQVAVTNESYDNPAEHQYVVTLDDVTGEAMACTCPHHVHRSAFCKHMTAVETVIDDGSLTAFPSEDDATDEGDAAPAECDCNGLGGFPCRPCVQAGQKKLPS